MKRKKGVDAVAATMLSPSYLAAAPLSPEDDLFLRDYAKSQYLSLGHVIRVALNDYVRKIRGKCLEPQALPVREALSESSSVRGLTTAQTSNNSPMGGNS
jgi:hypothetical protein